MSQSYGLVVAVLIFGFLGAQAEAQQAKEVEPDWLVLRVDTVRVTPTRPGTKSPWDGEKDDKSHCSTLGALAGAFTSPLGGIVVGGICSLGAQSGASDRDPTAPDLMLKLSLADDQAYFSPIADDRYAHDFSYSFLVPVAVIPPSGIKLQVMDQDGADRTSGELIGSFRLRRPQLLNAARGNQLVVLKGEGVLELELLVSAHEPTPRSLRTSVATSKGLVSTGQRALAGEVLTIRASGTYSVAGNRYQIGPEGYTDGRHTGYNLRATYAPNVNKGPHGAAIAFVGPADYLIGSCRRLVAPMSGIIAIGVNDRDLGNNLGTVQFEVEAAPPTAEDWLSPGISSPCPRPSATCDAVGKHVVEMARRELSGMDGDMKRMAEAMLGPLREEIVKKCLEDNWSEPAMQCMIAATTEKDFEQCEKLVQGG